MKQNIIITGGAGYVGASLCEALNASPEVESIIVYDELMLSTSGDAFKASHNEAPTYPAPPVMMMFCFMVNQSVCKPHSVLALPSHRPPRSSKSRAFHLRVHGTHPMLLYPSFSKGCRGRSWAWI